MIRQRFSSSSSSSTQARENGCVDGAETWMVRAAAGNLTGGFSAVSSVEAGRLLQPVSLISGDNWQAQREVERLSRELVASQVCISRPHQLARRLCSTSSTVDIPRCYE